MTTNEMELAWLAGLFDGEGCVRICERVRRRGGSLGVNYYITATINMTHAPTIRRVMDLSGVGAVYNVKNTAPRRRQFGWKATNNAAQQFLVSIEPFSLTKRAEILCCLEAMNIRMADGRSGTRKRLSSDTLHEIKKRASDISRMKLFEFPAFTISK